MLRATFTATAIPARRDEPVASPGYACWSATCALGYGAFAENSQRRVSVAIQHDPALFDEELTFHLSPNDSLHV